MKNSFLVKAALSVAVKSALKEHHDKYGTYRNLDWFNASTETTDFYIAQAKESQAA